MNKPLISRVVLSGMEESIIAAKYPMAVDIDDLSMDITPGVAALAHSESGHGHDQFLTGVKVDFDLHCTNKMWVEIERYKFVTFVSSQSTMHKIAQFDIASSCNTFVDRRIIEVVEELKRKYLLTVEVYGKNSKEARVVYLELLYNVPSGFKLTARLTTNYRALKTVYQQRKGHRLPEWQEFCRWCETLPESHFITGIK